MYVLGMKFVVLEKIFAFLGGFYIGSEKVFVIFKEYFIIQGRFFVSSKEVRSLHGPSSFEES